MPSPCNIYFFRDIEGMMVDGSHDNAAARAIGWSTSTACITLFVPSSPLLLRLAIVRRFDSEQKAERKGRGAPPCLLIMQEKFSIDSAPEFRCPEMPKKKLPD
jgi:hypothetical protein